MGLMNKLIGGEHRSPNDYVEIETNGLDATAPEADIRVHVAMIGNKQDVIAIKDAIYDGDIVIADITRHSTSDRTMEHITDDLQQVTREVGGDIIQKDEDQLIITPGSVKISREKLGE